MNSNEEVKEFTEITEEELKCEKKKECKKEKKFLDGFKMLYANLQGVMEKYDVKMIDGSNKPFDPVYHNAILTEKVEGVDGNVVIDVLQKGYIYNDKVIRPAMVKVSE